MGNFDRVVISVSIDLPSNSQQDAQFHCLAYDHSRADWDGLHYYLIDVKGRISLNLVLLLLLVNYMSGFMMELMYMLHIVSIRSSLSHLHGFHLRAAAIIHRNNFFCLCQQNKSSESKEKIRKASNSYKSVLEAARLAYANKTKESIACRKLGSLSICLIANSVLNKSKSAIPQASAYEKQGRATIGCLIMKFRGYGCVKSCMPPPK